MREARIYRYQTGKRAQSNHIASFATGSGARTRRNPDGPLRSVAGSSRLTGPSLTAKIIDFQSIIAFSPIKGPKFIFRALYFIYMYLNILDNASPLYYGSTKNSSIEK